MSVGRILVAAVLASVLPSCGPTPPTQTEILQSDVNQLVHETQQLRLEVGRLEQLVSTRIPQAHYCTIAVKNLGLPKDHAQHDYVFDLKLDRTACELVKVGELEVLSRYIQ